MSEAWKAYWPIFERLEDELCEFSFSLAFTDDHQSVYSARLSDLLLRACAECENIGKSLCREKSLVQKGIKLKHFNFPKLAKAISSSIHICSKDLEIIWPYQEFTNKIIRPFDRWQLAGKNNPVWFDASNDIKHNRIEKATVAVAHLQNVIHALGGLFILNLWLREGDITKHSEHFNLAQRRVTAYSKFFSPEKFLKLDSPGGSVGPVSGGNLRSLVFEWT